MRECKECGREVPQGSTEALCAECAEAKARRSRLSVRTYIREYPLTAALIGFNLVLFIGMVAGAATAKPFSWAAVADRLLHPSPSVLLRWGADYGPYTLDRQFWRLLTAVFVHIGIIHLVVNLWYLLNLGALSEVLFSRRTYLFLYFFTGIAGSVVSVWWNPLGVSAGASGALFGLTGAVLVTLRFARLPLPRRVIWFAIVSLVVLLGVTIFYGMKSQMDNAAHIGGLIAGVLTGVALLAWDRTPDDSGHELRLHPGTAVVLALVLLTAATYVWRTRRFVVPMDKGRVMVARGQVDGGIAELKRAVALAPPNRYGAEAYRLLGDAAMRRGDRGTAQANLVRATELAPKDAQTWATLAIFYLSQRKPQEALLAMQRSADLEPQSAQRQEEMGLILQSAGKIPEAIAAYQKALQLDPKLTPLHYNLGVAYIRAQQFDKAIEELNRYAAEFPKDPEVYRALAYAYKSKGMLVESEAAAAKAEQLSPRR